ncbi:MAG TPA: DnaB-like helicase C-terminal domain-containing protein [Polyangiaceae bacterium]|nr:DnaB-like helicase C-terminal domain-containing protein [Polyangiaceae bacterium]
MTPEKPAHPSTLPLSLASIQVDVATRLGAPVPVTPTGLKGLDTMLGGGLRAGTVLSLSGQPGSGRTALSLLIAYMAARTRAGVIVTSVTLDETEVVARLAARAINREYPAARISYATIWTGEAFAHDETRRVVNSAVETVHQKVGGFLHLGRISASAPLHSLGDRLGAFWARHERLVVVVDDLEAAVADPTQQGATDVETRVLDAAFALRALAERGAAVICTCLDRHTDLVAPAATACARIVRMATGQEGEWGAELVLTKNRVGPVGIVPLHLAPGTMQLTEGRSATGTSDRA